MRINFRIILLALPLVFGACSDSSDADTRPATETISVSVGSGPKINIESEDRSRTQLGEDGVSVKWASDDQIALWAVNSRSETLFSKQAFKLYHYNTDYNTAKFRGDIPQMPADTYTYYAVSPVPSESDGTQATYLIPDVQDGGFNGDWDVMVADPVKAPALEKNDTGETVQFQFRHKVHVLKIRIPKNDLGEKVSEITLAFPQPVTGRMTVDAADPDAAPTLTGGNNTLTLRFDTPKDAGDVVFAVIAPVELTAEQPVTITATGATRESQPKTFAGKHFAEGHTTPIAYHIPKVGPTTLRISLPDAGKKTLGENITSFTLTAAEGINLGEGSNVRTFQVSKADDFDFVFDEFPEALAGQSVAVSYESENALLSGGSFVIPKLIAGGMNTIATLRVPYLFEEKFDTVNGNGHDDEKNTGNASCYELSDMGLIGWSGQRVGSNKEAKAVRINSRHEGAWNINAMYNGRLTSPALSGLKSEVPVKIKFYTSGSSDNQNANILCQFGITTNTGNVTYTDSDMTPIGNVITLSTGCSYFDINILIDNLPTFNATSQTRLSWKVTNNDSQAPFVGSYTRYYAYLDNIKVSIVNE